MSADIKIICLIDGPPELEAAFRGEGVEVVSLEASPAPFFDVAVALEEKGIVPDLVLQVERLGVRSVLTGVDSLDCPLMFWAIDPHLNAYWHSVYARLFDVVCCTQKAWMDRLARHGAQDVRWLPWFAPERPLVDWEAREHGLAFVGRVTAQRPARKWMVDFLADKGAGFNPAIRDSIPKLRMLDLYDTSKIIPNESIFGEVNFRLFEGAACGCLVIGQDIEEQAELFEPGREMDTFSHVAELDEKLSLYLNNDKLVRTMARAAHARVQAEHLPVHRARRILEYARDAARNRVNGAEARKWTALAAAAMWESGHRTIDAQVVLSLLGSVEQDGDVMAATLRTKAADAAPGALAEAVKGLLTMPTAGESALNLTASMLALGMGEFNWAKTFWYRHLESQGVEQRPPESPNALYTLWAKDLHRRGMTMRSGFGFDASSHVPAAAMECLMMVLGDDARDLSILRLLDSMLRPIFGTEQMRVGYLSILTLHERDDWRLALEIGLANLMSFRLESGMEELHLARELAHTKGQEMSFMRVLKGRDPSGVLARRLGD